MHMNRRPSNCLKCDHTFSLDKVLSDDSQDLEPALCEDCARESARAQNLLQSSLDHDSPLELSIQDISQIQVFPPVQHRFSTQNRPRRVFSKEEVASEIKRFEDLLSKIGFFFQKTEKVFREDKKAISKTVRKKFQEFRFLLNAKEGQLLHEINSFYDLEIDELRTQLGGSSRVKHGIARMISEYKQIIQIGRPVELFDDLSAVYQIIQETVHVERMSKIDERLQEMKQKIDLILDNQSAALKKITVMTEDLALIHQEINLKLNEKFSSNEKLVKYLAHFNNQPNLALDAPCIKSSLNIQGGFLEILYPFDTISNQDLSAFQQSGTDISVFQFKISSNLEQICQEDLLKLCFIRSKLPNVRTIYITLTDYTVSDDALLDIFSSLFWNNNSLVGLYFSYNKDGSFEKSILYLAENILSATPNLKNLELNFGCSRSSNQTHSFLNQTLSRVVQNLTLLYLSLPLFSDMSNECGRIVGLQDLFIDMPNLNSLMYFSTQFDDAILEDFILNTLPSLKNLTSFQFFIPLSNVTDSSVKKLFKSFPQEWYTRLTRLRVSLDGTYITNDSLREFIDETIRRFTVLKDFKLLTDGWWRVSKGIRQKISQWEKNLSGESN